MSPRRFSAASLFLFALFSIVAPHHSAMAQGKFAGTWTVKEVARPDWTEPTFLEPIHALKVGDVVTFASGAVIAPEPFACAQADYQQRVVDSSQIFRDGIVDAAKNAEVVQKFAFSNLIAALLVECDLATFEFYEGGKGLVVEFDNMMYVLTR